MARINMMPDEMLKKVDQAATEEHLCRRAFLQKASRQYLDARRQEKEANE